MRFAYFLSAKCPESGGAFVKSVIFCVFPVIEADIICSYEPYEQIISGYIYGCVLQLVSFSGIYKGDSKFQRFFYGEYDRFV